MTLRDILILAAIALVLLFLAGYTAWMIGVIYPDAHWSWVPL